MKLYLSYAVFACFVLMPSCIRQQEASKLMPKQSKYTGKWGYVDGNGKVRIPFKYNQAWDFSVDLAIVQFDKLGFIDKTGKIVVAPKYDVANMFSDGTAFVKLDNKWGLVDKSGHEVIPPKYDEIEPFFDGLARVKLNNKWGYIDEFKNEVIPPKYDLANKFSEGMASVCINDKYGHIDKTGKVITPLKYEFARDFSEGLAQVTFNGMSGYVDESGDEVIPLIYSYAEDFTAGLAKVLLILFSTDTFYIDKTGLLYAKRDEFVFLEKIPGLQLNKINDYRLKLNKSVGYGFRYSQLQSRSSGPFSIHRPYLVFNTKIITILFNKDRIIYEGILTNSENDLSTFSVDSLKTVIIKYDFLDFFSTYTPEDKTKENVTINSYGTYLVYYDLIKKEVIGHDMMYGPLLPKRTTELENRYNSMDDIEKKVASRLQDSKKIAPPRSQPAKKPVAKRR